MKMDDLKREMGLKWRQVKDEMIIYQNDNTVIAITNTVHSRYKIILKKGMKMLMLIIALHQTIHYYYYFGYDGLPVNKEW